MTLPVCDHTGLSRLWCDDTCPLHGSGFGGLTPAELELLAHRFDPQPTTPTTTPQPAYQPAYQPLPEYQAQQRWAVQTPDHTRCDNSHTRPPGAVLCPTCDDLLDRLLGDVPAMAEDLHIALRKDTRFPTRPTTGQPDEAPIPVNLGASQALAELARALNGNPATQAMWRLANRHRPDETQLLDRLSSAMRHAHRIIERPADRVHVGNCPACNQPLETERGHDVRCPTGDYTATWDDHLNHILDNSQDRLLTESELALALGLERRTIRNLTRRMTGHQITRPHLTGHTITTTRVTVYRLGDITQAATTKGLFA